jgi:diguanylate cyclase
MRPPLAAEFRRNVMVSDGSLGIKVVKELTEAGIEPTPSRFEIWYLHRKGAEPEMSEQIHRWLEMHHVVKPHVLDRLHKEYLQHAAPLRKILGIVDKFDTPVDSVTEIVRGLSNSMRTFRMETARQLEALAQCPGNGREASDILDEINAYAADMVDINLDLEGQLEESLAEISALRGALAETERVATTDQMTGLVNRRTFEERLATLYDEAGVHGSDLSVVVCDVDQLKSINDQWGHSVGDDVLKLVSSILAQNTKGKDVVARYGGDEFVLLLPGARAADALSLAQKIKSELSSKRLRRKRTGDSIGQLTISFGVSSFDAAKSPEDVLAEAETALTRAKSAGGNRVLSFDRLKAEDSQLSAIARMSA